MKRKLIPLFVFLSLLMGGAALYLFLDYEGRLPWNRGEEPAGLRVSPKEDEARRRAALMRRRLEVLAAIERKIAEGIPDEGARKQDERACALFLEGDYDGAARAFDAAVAALVPPKPKARADGRPEPKPMSPAEKAKKLAELRSRFEKAQARLEAHPKDSVAKDSLFDALGDAFTYLDGGNLRDAETKIDEVEYGLPLLPK